MHNKNLKRHVYLLWIAFGFLFLCVTGCSVTRTYSPNTSPIKYQSPQLTSNRPYLGVAYSVIEFESDHLSRVDIKQHLGTTYDLSQFGKFLRDELAKKLQETGRFAPLSLTGQLIVRGHIDAITVTQHASARLSATGAVTYEVRVAGIGTESGIRDTIFTEVQGDFSSVIDILRLQLAYDIARRISEDERLPKIAALARSKGTMPQYSEKDPGRYANKTLASTTTGHPVPDLREAVAAKRWAVIIGISNYKYSGQNGLNNLIFADDDAKAFARTLQRLGWSDSHINILINKKATQRNILIALESWLTKAGPNDQIVLFWAGHGFPDPEDPEKVYFACYDTDIRIPATGYRMDRVRSILEERNTKNVIVFADTCHAGKLITRGQRGISIVPNIEKMRREQSIPKGWIFMVGADTDRQAIEHTSWTNGAFTHSLIKGLSGEADGFQSSGVVDGTVTLGELRSYMNTAMPDETHKVLGVAKRPVITTSTGDPDIWNLTLQIKE